MKMDDTLNRGTTDMKKQTKITWVAIGVLIIAGATGCGTVAKKTTTGVLPYEDLERHARETLSPQELEHFQVPYRINKELADLAQTAVDRRLSDVDIAKKIALLILLDNDGLGVSYSRNHNYTALEVYEHRKANCISYTNLFVGMARSVGLLVNYAEVTEVESFDKIGGTVVYNSHICAVVFSGPKPHIIDFSLRSYPQYHAWRTITDVEAAASYYNNLGSYHVIMSSDTASLKRAEEYFSISMKLDPAYVQAYNNLGVLRMRNHDIEGAMNLYQRALDIQPGYFAAYANLGNIYTSRGETGRAIELMRSAIKASPDNHFAYLNLAKLYISTGQPELAEKCLKDSLDINKRFTDARHELGRLYLRSGRSEEAKRQFALALKYQPDDNLAVNKMELIERLSAKSEPKENNPF